MELGKCQNLKIRRDFGKGFFASAGLEPVCSSGLVLLIAVPAINRPALGRLEWNLGLYSTFGALHIEHLAGAAIVSAAAKSTGSRFSVHYYYLLAYFPLRPLQDAREN